LPHTSSNASKTQPLLSDSIQANHPFSLEICLRFTDLNPPHLQAQQLKYEVQCRAKHLGIGQVVYEMTANVPLSPNGAYSAILSDLTLSDPGAYRLQVIANINGQTAAYFKVPLVQVAPF
jgi:hypothetical protein